MPPPADVDALAQRLVDIYAAAQRQIDAELAALLENPEAGRRRARLEEMAQRIRAVTSQADQQAQLWLTTELPQLYDLGAFDAQSVIGTFTQVNRGAVSQLAGDTFDHLLEATRLVNQSTKVLVRTVARDEVLQKLVEGRTALDAGRRMAELLDERGIHSVTYADGSRQKIGTYAEMVARTVSGEAYNLGTLKGSAAAGTEWFECFDGSACGWADHDDPDLANGKIVTVDEAIDNPLSHPNCRRAFGPRPDISSADEAVAAAPSTADEQLVAQQRADDARAAAQQHAESRGRRRQQVLDRRQAMLSRRQQLIQR